MVIDSRKGIESSLAAARALLAGRPNILRRRGCRACNHRWSTVEVSITDLSKLAREAGNGPSPRDFTRLSNLLSELGKELEKHK